MKAMLDRIEENQWAVLLIEELGKEVVLSKEKLPEESQTNQWFDITIENDQVVSIAFDAQETSLQQEKVKNKMAKLHKNKKESKFKRKS